MSGRADHDCSKVWVVCERCGERQRNRLGRGCARFRCGHLYGVYHDRLMIQREEKG